VSEWEELTSGWPSLSNSNGIIDAILDCEALIKPKSEENVVSVGLCCWRGRDSEKSVARINVLISRETGKVCHRRRKGDRGRFIYSSSQQSRLHFLCVSLQISFFFRTKSSPQAESHATSISERICSNHFV